MCSPLAHVWISLRLYYFAGVSLLYTFGQSSRPTFLETSTRTRLEHFVTGAVFSVAPKLSFHAPLEQVSAILCKV